MLYQAGSRLKTLLIFVIKLKVFVRKVRERKKESEREILSKREREREREKNRLENRQKDRRNPSTTCEFFYWMSY